MAIDEVLLKTIEGPTLRIYRWAEPAVSFGYFGKFAEAKTFAYNRELVRRWTGGGMVEHGADVTYTLLVPPAHPWCQARAAESYRLVHEAIAAFLQTLGGAAQVVPVTAEKTGDACFANPVQYDLVAAGKKLAGAAQRRTRWGLLHQGSIQATGLPEGWSRRLGAAFSDEVTETPLSPEIEAEAERLSAVRYATDGWTQRV